LKRDIHIPVRDLVEYTLRSGDLVIDFSISSGVRAVDGIRAHRKIQEARPGEYRPEVTVSHQVETKDFNVTVAGRIDGVYHYPDRIVVDEIKTTTRNLDTIEKEQNPIHWGQVKVYAYLYAVQQKPTAIEVQLTYYQLDAGETREFRQVVTPEELEIFFNDLLNRYLQWLAALEKWHQLRDESIVELEFPYPVYRPGQRRMALDIYYAIEKKEQLILEAPTGIGKTMAAVFPAVKAMGSGLTEKFF
jgi:DNA excision repair protein ERCC-2